MPSVVEVRTYTTKPGKRAEFLDTFRARAVAAFEGLGIRVVGPFPAVENTDVFCWMLVFPDAVSRDAMRKRFYDSDSWQNDLKNALPPILETSQTVLVEDAEDVFARSKT
jgi:hypothetical protein